MKLKTVVVVAALFSGLVNAETQLNERCVVNVLNRTIQVSENGGWALPNIPSFMGRVRARATCTLEDGSTVSGQSDYFTLTNNGITEVGKIKFEGIESIPKEIYFVPGSNINLSSIGSTKQLKITARYVNGSEKDVTAASSGINYSSTNTAVATVNPEGLVTARGNGVVLINARKDGVLASQKIVISTSGDQDGDGLPDEWELENGLNPADPVDAFEDRDSDKLSNLEEYNEGTNPSSIDTDGDGLNDYEELKEKNTSPLLADSDGDGLNDKIEILTGTNPNDSSSVNYAVAVQSISVTPPTVLLSFSSVSTEVSMQLQVTGTLIDGSTLDLTSKARGTSYSSSNLSVVNFGLEDGKIFGGQPGNAVVTIQNGIHSIPLAIAVQNFTPSFLSEVSVPGYANNVDIAGDFAYVAAGNAGLQVFDISNRNSPKIIGSLDTEGVAIDIRVRGGYAYLADGESGFKIINISNPKNPQLLSNLDTVGVTQDLQIMGQYAFLANGNAGIEIIDISNPTDPIPVSSLDNIGEVKGIDVEGNNLVVVTGAQLRTIDVADKFNPQLVGSIYLGLVKDVVIKGNFAYVAAFTNGYRIIKLGDLRYPEVVGGDASIFPRDVELSGDLAFFVDQLLGRGTAYFNIEDPLAAVWLGTIPTRGVVNDFTGATGIAVDPSFVYVTGEAKAPQIDFGAAGDTYFRIDQYRVLSDNRGIAPQAFITSPAHAQITVENKSVLISANAIDDLAVKQVDFLVDNIPIGFDTTAPYEIPYVVPSGKLFINIQVRATDLGDLSSTSDVIRLNIQPDKDSDGLGNDEEGDVYQTSPSNPDTDGDGLNDGKEISIGTNPLRADSDNDGISDFDENSAKTDPLNPDTNSPSVESTFPLNNATAVPENQGISITFNEVILPRSVIRNSITIRQEGFEVTPSKLSRMENGREVLLTPSSLLKSNTRYIVTVSGIKDMAGNPLSSAYEFSFVTGTTPDTTKPTVIAITPTNSAVDVPVNSELTMVLSEPIDKASIDETKIYLKDTVLNQNVAGTFSVSEDNRSITFIPSRAYLIGRKYTFTVGGIKDFFGNLMTQASYSFTTAFEMDGKSPEIVAVSVSQGDIDIPLNARFQVLFNEPISGLSAQNLSLKREGSNVSVNYSIDTTRKMLTIKPVTALEENAAYQLVLEPVADLSGNLLARGFQTGFITGSTIDTQRGSITRFVPGGYEKNVPLATKIRIAFNERIDPTTVLPNTFVFTNESEGRELEGSAEISPDRKSLYFVPTQPLKPLFEYRLKVSDINKIYDIAGNYVNYSSVTFTTGMTSDGNDKSPPTVLESTLSADPENMPINTRVLAINFNEPLDPGCVNAQTVRVVQKSNSAVVIGTVKLTENFQGLEFSPNQNLNSETEYIFVLDGVCDLSGNKLPMLQQSFRTNSITQPDNTYPEFSVNPLSGSTNVPINTKITYVFSEPIDPARVRLNLSYSYQDNFSTKHIIIPGRSNLEGNTITFIPDFELPLGAYISASGTFYDLAGNSWSGGTTQFQTTTNLDTTAPTIILNTPANGAMDVGPSTHIILTFSEPLLESTITEDNFGLFIGDTLLHQDNYGVSRSLDNRTITLYTSNQLPSAKTITVVATSGIKDLAGNRLQDFAATFNTAIVDKNLTRPNVVRQYPTNGASNVRNLQHITLYTSKPVNLGSSVGSIYVAADGALIAGRTQLEAGDQSITFIPNAPFPENALIEVFLTENIRDLSGNLFTKYRGSFRTGSESGHVVGTRPLVSAQYPINAQVNVSTNPLIEVLFNEKLNPSTVSGATVQLRKLSPTGVVQPSLISLNEDGNIIRINPDSRLEKNTRYYVTISQNIEDLDGEKPTAASSAYFNTGIDAIEDTQVPIITHTNPSNESENVPLNPLFNVRFDEPIHPLSFILGDNDQIAFSNENREVRYIKSKALPNDSELNEKLTNILDRSGNSITDYNIAFRTASAIDLQKPELVSINPFSGSTNVPINATIKLQFSEPLNDLTANLSNISLQDKVLNVPVETTLQVNGDSTQLTLTPKAPLAINRAYAVNASVADLAGNSSGSLSYTFTTGPYPDVVAPDIMAVNVNDGQENIARNARIRILFSEPINVQKLDGVNLSVDGSVIQMTRALSNDRMLLTLTPSQLMRESSSYTLAVSGIQDLSGNQLSQPLEVDFRTSTEIDIVKGKIIDTVPSAYNNDKFPINGRVKIALSESVDPVSVQAGTFTVVDVQTTKQVEGNIVLSPDGKTLEYAPTNFLSPGSKYYFNVGKDQPLYDMAGNIFDQKSETFFTGSSVDQSPPSIASTNIISGSAITPINAIFSINFGEAISSLCVNQNTVKLINKNNSSIVNSVLRLDYDSKTVSLTPSEHLSSMTNYEVVINGICDLAGNSLADLHLPLQTNNESVDLIRPVLMNISPSHGATNVPTTSKIVITLNEPIDPTRINNLQVTSTGYSKPLAGSWDVNGGILTFTPLVELPGSTLIYVYLYSLYDLAGNEANVPNPNPRTFTTAASVDTSKPTIQSISPGNGAMDIGTSTSIVINFSESLQENTLTKDNFLLFIDGKISKNTYNLYRSPDNRTVTLSSVSPFDPAKLITVVVTNSVSDLSGNRLDTFASTFNTAYVDKNVTRPSVYRMSPTSGATEVKNLTEVSVYTTKALNSATISGGIYVAANGTLINGVATLDSTNQVIKFVADQVIPENSLIEVFLNEKIKDLSGNAMNSYRASFRTGIYANSLPTVKPGIAAIYPVNTETDVKLNPLIELRFTEPLNISSLTPSVIQMRKASATGVILPTQTTLGSDGKTLRIIPQSLLEKNTRYYINLISGIEDIDGDKITTNSSFYFTTGVEAVEDTQPLQIARTSPWAGAQNVPVNPYISLSFSEPIHPLSFPSSGNEQVSFLEGNKQVRYFKDKPYIADANVTEVLSGISDKSGNEMADYSISFNTGNVLDAVKPSYPISVSPASTSVGVPITVSISVLMSEPINPVILSSTSFYLQDMSVASKVASTTGVSSDGRQLTLTPTLPLKPNTSYRVYLTNISDLAGNVSAEDSFGFITGTLNDVTSPEILAIGIENGESGIPRNAKINVRFSEAININKLDSVNLLLNGIRMQTEKSLDNSRALLTLTPMQLFQPGANYQLEILSVEDISGNLLTNGATTSFSAGASVDTVSPVRVGISPLSDAIGVSLDAKIEIKYNEVLDVSNNQSSGIVVRNLTENADVQGTIQLSVDRKGVIFTPASLWKKGHKYRFYAGGSNTRIYDKAGNDASEFNSTFTAINN